MAKTKEGPSALTVFVDKVGQLSRPQRILICVAAFIVVGVVFTFVSFKPNWMKISELTANLEAKEQEVETARIKASQLPQLRKKRAEAEERLKAVAASLPKEKEIPELLDRVSLSGNEAGLEWLLFQPQDEKEVPEKSYVEMPVAVQVAGDYHGIATFFDKVAHLPRIVNIKNVGIKPSGIDQGGWRRLEAQCQAVTYRFLDTESADAKK